MHGSKIYVLCAEVEKVIGIVAQYEEIILRVAGCIPRSLEGFCRRFSEQVRDSSCKGQALKDRENHESLVKACKRTEAIGICHEQQLNQALEAYES